jgi:hypothetical protein
MHYRWQLAGQQPASPSGRVAGASAAKAGSVSTLRGPCCKSNPPRGKKKRKDCGGFPLRRSRNHSDSRNALGGRRNTTGGHRNTPRAGHHNTPGGHRNALGGCRNTPEGHWNTPEGATATRRGRATATRLGAPTGTHPAPESPEASNKTSYFPVAGARPELADFEAPGGNAAAAAPAAWARRALATTATTTTTPRGPHTTHDTHPLLAAAHAPT